MDHHRGVVPGGIVDLVDFCGVLYRGVEYFSVQEASGVIDIIGRVTRECLVRGRLLQSPAIVSVLSRIHASHVCGHELLKIVDLPLDDVVGLVGYGDGVDRVRS